MSAYAILITSDHYYINPFLLSLTALYIDNGLPYMSFVTENTQSNRILSLLWTSIRFFYSATQIMMFLFCYFKNKLNDLCFTECGKM